MKDTLTSVPMLGSLWEVTNFIPAPDLVGVAFVPFSYTEALHYTKEKPWNYLRKMLVMGRCFIQRRLDGNFMVITNRFTAIVSGVDYGVVGVYPTIVKLAKREDYFSHQSIS